MPDTFFQVGDRVCLHAPDGDGHVAVRDDFGTVDDVDDQSVLVRWDNGDQQEHSENDLDLV